MSRRVLVIALLVGVAASLSGCHCERVFGPETQGQSDEQRQAQQDAETLCREWPSLDVCQAVK